MSPVCPLYIQWNADPVLFEFGNITVGWYGFFFALMLIFGQFVLRKLAVQDGKPADAIVDIMIVCFLGGIIGARLAHVFFYDWAYFSQNLLEIPQIWQGGLASHGGLLGCLAGLWAYSLYNPVFSFSWMIDRLPFVIVPGGAMVRLGNLFNSELYGKVTDVSWAFVFERVSPLPRHPSQLYEAIFTTILFLFLWFYHQKKRPLPPYRILGWCLVLGFSGRFFLEFWKEDGSTAQMLNLPVILLGLGLLFYSYRTRSA